jgi:hypothetical protein
MKNLKKLQYWAYLVGFNLLFLISPQALLAQVALPSDLRPNYIPDIAGNSAEDKIFNLSGSLIITIMQLSGGVAILILIINGFNYILARGEEGEMEQAKTNIFWALGGLILIMISYVIIRFVVKLTLIVDEVN